MPNAIKYSPTEERLLELMPSDGKTVDTATLTKKFYARRETPFHGQIYIAGAMRTLIEKSKRNRETFKIRRTPLGKPRKIQFWLET